MARQFTKDEVITISKAIHTYFNLVSQKRIYDLILQVKSIDVALHLLFCHKESTNTIDHIVYEYLHYIDNIQKT